MHKILTDDFQSMFPSIPTQYYMVVCWSLKFSIPLQTYRIRNAAGRKAHVTVLCSRAWELLGQKKMIISKKKTQMGFKVENQQYNVVELLFTFRNSTLIQPQMPLVSKHFLVSFDSNLQKYILKCNLLQFLFKKKVTNI